VVPLVFKTSLGAVRSPEGSTPSLLRQEKFITSGGYNLHFGSVAAPNLRSLISSVAAEHLIYADLRNLEFCPK